MFDASRLPFGLRSRARVVAALALIVVVATTSVGASHARAEGPIGQALRLRAPLVAMPDDLQRRLAHGRVGPAATLPPPVPDTMAGNPDERSLHRFHTAGGALVGIGGFMLLIGGASGASCDTSGPEAFAGFGCEIGAISVMSIGGIDGARSMSDPVAR